MVSPGGREVPLIAQSATARRRLSGLSLAASRNAVTRFTDQHTSDTLDGWRHDGQSIAPFPCVHPLVHIQGLGNGQDGGSQHARRFPPSFRSDGARPDDGQNQTLSTRNGTKGNCCGGLFCHLVTMLASRRFATITRHFSAAAKNPKAKSFVRSSVLLRAR
jgi:hypothetical protein